jgi:sugar phosphate isomerase/epimerase
MTNITRRKFIERAVGGTAAVWAAGAINPTASPDAEDARGPSPEARGQAPERVRPLFELGVASYTFREFDLEAAIAMTVRIGLRRICLKDMHLPLESTKTEIEAAIKKIREAGLVPYGCGVVYMKSPAEVERAFTYAKAGGMEVIIGVPDHELLPLAERKVRELGIKLAIHNHGPGDLLYPTPRSVLDKVRSLDPRVGLCLDIGHCLRSRVDPAGTVEECAGRLLDVHLKDVTAATKEGAPVEAGRGVIDMPRFLRALIKVKYRGTASFEFEKDGKDPMPGLAESVGYVRGILTSI